MGKSGGFLTPKAIANRIKAKGLQKLRWYCEMCQKQCRDENGFKCHCESESHQRQMALFSSKKGSFLDQYSKEFEGSFMDVLKRRFNTKRVHANMVYNEYISDRNHTHMNATKWETLTGFVQYLGRCGKCVVDETPKGWYIQYIDRDPEAMKRQAMRDSKEKMERVDDDRHRRYLEKQIELAKEGKAEDDEEEKYTELKRDDPNKKITFAVPKTAKPQSSVEATSSSHPANVNILAAREEETVERHVKSAGDGEKRKMSALDEIIERNERWKKQKRGDTNQNQESVPKQKSKRKDYWLHEGIVVKILNKKLKDGKYYKQKGVVRKVIERYVGEIKMIEQGDTLRLDQDMCETVIPKKGGEVLVVNGEDRGLEGVVASLDIDNYRVSVKLRETQEERKYDYEDVCRLY